MKTRRVIIVCCLVAVVASPLGRLLLPGWEIPDLGASIRSARESAWLRMPAGVEEIALLVGALWLLLHVLEATTSATRDLVALARRLQLAFGDLVGALTTEPTPASAAT